MRCHYRTFNTRNIRETIDSFARGPYVHLFNRYVFTLMVGAFLWGRAFTFLVVLSLICLVTTQILICENQTIWKLEILLRTIVAALLKTKCNGQLKTNHIKKREYFTTMQMIVKDEDYKYFAAKATFDAWSCPPSPPSTPQTHTHTHTPTKRTLSAWWPLPIPTPAHTTLFPIPITTNAQVFLSHNCLKRKETLFHKSWNFT